MSRFLLTVASREQHLTSGLFVGLSTLDLVHFTERAPGRNEKAFSRDSFIGAGGPATNAALAYAHLGGEAHLISAVGRHPTGALILGELAEHGVKHIDAAASRTEAPLVSSVVVSLDNGDRSIVTSPIRPAAGDSQLIAQAFQQARPEFVLVDGHEMELALGAARRARELGIPVVFDGGRWKDHFQDLLEHVGHALVSEAFRCPDGHSPEAVIGCLHDKGARYAAITRGNQPIIHSADDMRGTLPVRRIEAVDTLAAGDIFHGAYCFATWVLQRDFVRALEYAADVAGESCRHLGPRRWMIRRGRPCAGPDCET